MDDDVELSFQDVNLPLSQLLLPASQQLLLVLLLERSPGQLLLPGTELLPRGTSREKSVSGNETPQEREGAQKLVLTERMQALVKGSAAQPY